MPGRPRVGSKIDLSGPFFAKDPSITFRKNIRVMTAAMAVEGEADVRQQYASGQSSRAPISRGVVPTRVSGHVVGRVTSEGGTPFAVTAIISVNPHGLGTQQSVALMAAYSRVEKLTKGSRRTTTKLRQSRAVNQAELTRGLE